MPFDTSNMPKFVKNIGHWNAGNEQDVSPYIPYFDHIKDNIIALKDGRIMAMIKLDGMPYYLSNNATRNGNARRHFALLQILADPQTEIYEHLVCHDNVPAFVGSEGGSDYWQEFSNRYSARVLRGLKQYDWFISIIVKPRLTDQSFKDVIAGFFKKSDPVISDDLIRKLETKVRTVMAACGGQRPKRIGSYSKNNFLYSDIGRALSLIMTTRTVDVPYVQPIGSFQHVLYRERIVHGSLGFLIERGGGRSRASVGRMYGLNVYPKMPRVGMFDKLLLDNQEFHGARWVMTNSIRPISRAQASDRILLTLKRMEQNDRLSHGEIADLEDALEELASSQDVRGNHTFAFAVHADSMERLDEYASSIADILAGAGCSPAPAGAARVAMYWSQLPGNRDFNSQPAVIGLRRFTMLSSLEGHPTDNNTNKVGRKIRWGAPILRFINSGGGYYDHELFDGQIGHMLFCGPSGSGKTAAVGAMATAATALVGPKGSIITFDKDRSNKLTILNNGGTYTELKRGEDSGAAPLQRLENTQPDRNVLCDLISAMITADGGPKPSERAKARIARGVEFVMRQDAHRRQLGTVHAFLPPTSLDPSEAANRLMPWCRGERLGWAFDGVTDTLNFNQRMFGVDYTQLLQDNSVLSIMSGYLFHLFGKIVDGRRVIGIAEELKFLLPSPEFVKHFEDLLLTGRKKNVSFWPVIQQPEALLNHSIGPALLAQCRTRFLFKNELANYDAYMGLHCTPQEYAQVREGMTVGPWSVLIQRPGNKSVLCRFDLGVMPEDIAIVSGTPESVKHWDKLAELRKEFVETLPEV